ncbi:hypothetical protein AMS68_002021 [Peltaster fructicola]|uniref:Uncharacterized protein n=1 Tax=Peltaster fructicola TaxID=286661 RepID=A0A6H0XP53_9PEZI|nr:hypothetical protein AMS68_002021 [Peltaster fructicola]
MVHSRSVLSAEQCLGWLFSKGISRGGLREYDHDHLIAEIVQGIDVIKQRALALGQQAIRTSAEIARASDALYEQVGARVWPGRAHPSKPAWVADAGTGVCGGLYKKDLRFHDPQDHERLKSLFRHMILVKCRAFRQNRRQKDRPTAVTSANHIQASGESRDEVSVDDESRADEEDDDDGDFADRDWQDRRRDLDLQHWHETRGASVVVREGNDRHLRSQPREGRFSFSTSSTSHSASLLTAASGSAQTQTRTSEQPSSAGTESEAHASRDLTWNAPLSANDEQKLLQLSQGPIDLQSAKSRDATLNLLRRIYLELRVPTTGDVVIINLARCVSREALFKKIDETMQEHEEKAHELTFGTGDDDSDTPEELRRIVLRRGGFRDSFPTFLHCLRQIDNGVDTYNLVADVTVRRAAR